MTLRWPVMAIFIITSICGCATELPAVVQPDPDQNLKLVATDLVSALIQVRNLNPSTTTVQFSPPGTPFGNVLLRTFEDAGYGIQMVTDDRGSHYVSYAKRSSETDAGEVLDYVITINEFEARREYRITDQGIYPASLLFIKGVDAGVQITLDNDIFTEQGGDELFLSGVKPENKRSLAPGDVREVIANNNTLIIAGRRTQQQETLAKVRRAVSEKDKALEPRDMINLSRYKRIVVLFPNNQSLTIGEGNKIAIRQLVSDYRDNDVFEITACDDVDGENELAEERAVKIRDEIVSYDIPFTAVRRAPCIRANYRHQSDDSPIPVVIVQYRQ